MSFSIAALYHYAESRYAECRYAECLGAHVTASKSSLILNQPKPVA
jgi:hypothetical protein